MSPDKTGQPTLDELKAKGFKLDDKAPDDSGKPKDTPPDKTGGEPGKLDGKSEEDLRAMVAEQEKQLGKLSEKLDTFKGDAEYWRNKADSIERERQIYANRYHESVNQPKPDESKAPAKFNWEEPIETIDKVVDQKFEERDTAMSRQRTAEVIDDAKMAFQDGFKRAVRENPHLFEGDDFQAGVADFMFKYYAPYAEKGIPVSRYVGNPDVWKKVAQNRRLENEEFDYLQPEKTSPVSPTSTETPSGTERHSPVNEKVNFEDGASHMIDYFKRQGYVEGEEEAAELVRDERKNRAELEE